MVPEIQLTLKNEGTEFLGLDPLNGLGSQSLGLDMEGQDWMSLL